jgi:hypothetical protein
MIKLITLLLRVTALVGVVAALPSIARIAEQAKSMNSENLTAMLTEGGEKAGALDLAGGKGVGGQASSLASLSKLMGLVGGGDSFLFPAAKPKSKPAPSLPSTFIHYIGPDQQSGRSDGTEIMQLPPGANATIVDGRLQIYYPAKPQSQTQTWGQSAFSQ